MKNCCDTKIKEDEIDILKSKNLSATKNAIEIIKIFRSLSEPLSAQDILQRLDGVNESTVFRILKKFTNAQLIIEHDLAEGFKRYELAPNNHHHHFVKCNTCGRVDKISECDLSVFVRQLKKIGYKNLTHSIQFFGDCSSCRI